MQEKFSFIPADCQAPGSVAYSDAAGGFVFDVAALDARPPYANRGVVNTEDVFSLVNQSPFHVGQVLIDWLEFTILLPLEPEQVPEFLGLSGVGLADMPTGQMGYKTRQNIGPAVVLSNGSPGMGIHIICGGTAIKELSLDCMKILKKIALLNSGDYQTDIEKMFSEGGQKIEARRAQITRLDIALDDFAGFLPLPLLAQSLKAGHVSAKAKKYGIVEGGTIADGKTTARTYYIGKRSSNFMTRFYDKRQEQIDQGANPADLPEVWNRCEMELKAESANNAAAAILEAGNLNDPARALLNNFMSVKTPTDDSNKSRWPLAAWWFQFVATIDRLKVGKKIKKPTIESRAKWFNSQCTKTAAFLDEAYGPGYVAEAIKRASYKLDEKDIAAALEFYETRPQPNRTGQTDTQCPACNSDSYGVFLDSQEPEYLNDSSLTFRACKFCGQTFTITAEMAA